VSETKAKKEGKSFMVLAGSLRVLREGDLCSRRNRAHRGAVVGGIADGRVLFVEEKTAVC